jgi:hypothetical protein
MQKLLREAAHNEVLAGLARVATAIVSIAFMVVIIPAAAWVVSTTMAGQQLGAVQQTLIDAQTRRLDEHATLISEIRRTREADREVSQALRNDLSRALEKLDGQSRSLARIEALFDRSK